MRKILVIFVFIPSFAFATIGDEINAVLRSFFGGEGEDQSSATVPEKIEVPIIELPDNPSLQDVEELKKQVFLEEDDLAFTELEIEASLRDVEQMITQKQRLEGEVSQLDIQLGKVGRRLESLREQSQKRKQELVALTQQRSDLRALLRVKEREYKTFLQENYLRQESFGTGNEVSLLKWLFADATVSHLLEERNRAKTFEEEKKARLKSLQKLEGEIKTNEQYMAVLYGQVSKLRDQVAGEKKLLSDEVYTKAGRMADFDQQAEIKKQELRNLRLRQAQSTLFLQNLHQTVGEAEKHLETQVSQETESFFDLPLTLEPLKVTATYHDEEYQKEMGEIHNGVDFYAPFGIGVHTVAGGKIKKVGNNGYGYSYIVIEHADDFLTLYGHLSDIYVNEGMVVDRGEIIAKTGGEGGGHGTGAFSTGKHLHFEMMREGKYVDPMRFLKIE